MISSIASSGTGGRPVPAIGSFTRRRPAVVSAGVAIGKSEPNRSRSKTFHSVTSRIPSYSDQGR